MLEALLAVVTVVSFVVALITLYQSQSQKDRQAAATAVVSQKVDSTALSLEAAFGTINALVQIPKEREISVREMQALARIARSQVLLTARMLKQSEDLLSLWSKGELKAALKQHAGEITSDSPDDESQSGEKSV